MAEGLKLCDICSIVFHSGNPEGKFFYHSNIDQLSPETCPVCAMIRHECRKRQQPVDGISTVRYLNPDNSRGMLIEVEITNGQRYQLLLTKIFSPGKARFQKIRSIFADCTTLRCEQTLLGKQSAR
jgi:hypothetical protein